MIRVEKQGWVTTIILDRPQRRNAVDAATAEALFAAFQAFDADDTARVAVLWGDHGNFCAGADLKAIAVGRPNRLDPSGAGPLGPTRMLLSKPVIAAIAGYAVAGGLELALWCDVRVAEEDAVMGVYCRRWGVPLIDGGTQRLPAMIGLGRAMDLVLTGRSVDATEAMAIGLVNRLVAKGKSREEAENLARMLAEMPQAALRADRLSVLEGAILPDGIQKEFERGVAAVVEGAEGAKRFQKGREESR